jgi:hypothetical protein
MEPISAAVTSATVTLRLSQTAYELKAVDQQARELLGTTDHVNTCVKTARELRHQKSAFLSSSLKFWIDGVILETERTVQDVAALIEPARVDMRTNSGRVSLKNRVAFVLRDSPRVETNLHRLSIASGNLNSVMVVLTGNCGVNVNTDPPPAYREIMDLRNEGKRSSLHKTRDDSTLSDLKDIVSETVIATDQPTSAPTPVSIVQQGPPKPSGFTPDDGLIVVETSRIDDGLMVVETSRIDDGLMVVETSRIDDGLMVVETPRIDDGLMVVETPHITDGLIVVEGGELSSINSPNSHRNNTFMDGLEVATSDFPELFQNLDTMELDPNAGRPLSTMTMPSLDRQFAHLSPRLPPQSRPHSLLNIRTENTLSNHNIPVQLLPGRNPPYPDSTISLSSPANHSRSHSTSTPPFEPGHFLHSSPSTVSLQSHASIVSNRSTYNPTPQSPPQQTPARGELQPQTQTQTQTRPNRLKGRDRRDAWLEYQANR